MAKKRFTFIVIILLAILFYVTTSFSHSLVMRRTVFLHGHPITALTTHIDPRPDTIQKRYGRCFTIDNTAVNNGTENAIPGICMKRGIWGFYYDVTIGDA